MQMDCKKTAPVGVFDSGVGGLTVRGRFPGSFRMKISYTLETRQEFRTEVSRRIQSSVFQSRLYAF